MSFVDERDKVPYKNLSWNEPIMLLELLKIELTIVITVLLALRHFGKSIFVKM